MDITVIGAGNVARLLAGGHGVALLGATQEKAQALAGDLPREARTGTLGDPLGVTWIGAFLSLLRANNAAAVVLSVAVLVLTGLCSGR